jgi:membrane associated rhomboid family serine protease
MRLSPDGGGPQGGGGSPGLPRRFSSGAGAPAINAPPIVLFLCVALIVLYGLFDLQSEAVQNQIIVYGAFWPGRFSVQPPFDGALNTFLCATSLVTYSFLHGSWTHVGMNAVWLLAFGAPVARRVGTARFLLLYAVAGFGGAGLHLILHWGELTPILGASACVAGLTGAMVRFAFRRFRAAGDVTGPLADLSDRNVIMFVAVWLGLNLVTGLLSYIEGAGPPIAWEAHVGGFIVGLIGMPFLDRPPKADPLYQRLR